MPDVLDRARSQIDDRLAELAPVVDELQTLDRMEQALRPKVAAKKPKGRPRGSGQRAQQALDVIRDRPGVTIPQIARTLRIQPNYLYRVLAGLADDGKVRRAPDGKGWIAA